MITVARLYRFPASHSLPGVEGYDQPHTHLYTIQVAASDINVWQGGMVVDTQKIDDLMAPVVARWTDADLNVMIPASTTVENLAKHIKALFTGWEFNIEVTVWEDDDRWGRA